MPLAGLSPGSLFASHSGIGNDRQRVRVGHGPGSGRGEFGVELVERVPFEVERHNLLGIFRFVLNQAKWSSSLSAVAWSSCFMSRNSYAAWKNPARAFI